MFVDQHDLERFARGSVESRMRQVLAAAELETGAEISVFATHEDRAYGVCGERVLKLTWGESATPKVRVEDVDVPLYGEHETRGFCAKMLRDAVSEMCRPDGETDCKRLQFLAKRLDDRGYWASEVLTRARDRAEHVEAWVPTDKVLASELAEHGIDRGAALSSIPRTPYGRINSSRLHRFAKEMRESLQTMCETVTNIVEYLGGLDEDRQSDRTRGVSTVASAWATDAQDLGGLFEEEQLPAIAEFHDLFAGQLSPMVLMVEILKAHPGDSNDAPATTSDE